MRRRYPGAPSRRAAQSALSAIVALAAGSGAFAQTAIVTTTHTVVAQGQPPAVEHDFSTTQAGSYWIRLTDLPGDYLLDSSPLAAAALALTQGNTIVDTLNEQGMRGTLETPITFNATANTPYTIHVVGIPGAVESGSIGENVFDSAGNNVLSSWTDTLSAPSQRTGAVGFVAETVTNGGTWSVTFQDWNFPAPLTNPHIEVFDSSEGISLVRQNRFGSFSRYAPAGETFTIVAAAQEQSGAAGGLFSVSFSSTGEGVALKLAPVGGVQLLQPFASGKPQASFTLGSSSATLGLTDLSFPTVPLSSAGAALVDITNPQIALTVTGPGQQTLSAPVSSDAYQVYAYGVPDSTATDGSYAVAVRQGTAFPFVAAQAVSSSSANQAFSFDSGIPATGSYVLTLTDFNYPAPLTTDALAAVQNGQLVKSINAAGNFSATLTQGPVTLLAFGSAGGQPASPGLMRIDLSPAGTGGSIFDATEGIGAGFSATTFIAQSAQALKASVADLKFPEPLATINLAVTSGTTLVGTNTSAGSADNVTFQTTANATYNVNVLAAPPTPPNIQQLAAGTYAMSVTLAPVVVTLRASSSTVSSGGTVILAWSASGAASCTASASPANSGWSGSRNPAGGPVTTSAIAATTTFALNCTGPGGAATGYATVTVSTASGGGSIDPELLLVLAAMITLRARAARAAVRADH